MYRKNPPDHDALRKLATARISGRAGDAAASLDLPQVQYLLEDLEIHQIELELQNESLNATRAQLERALNHSNELYDFLPVGSLLIDASGAITKLNLMCAKMLGAERARLLGSRLGLYLAEPQRLPFNVMLERAKVLDESQLGELVLQLEGHEAMVLQTSVVWIGLAVGWQITMTDVSEQRRIEAQLHASEERLGLALTAVGDGMWDWQVSTGEVLLSDSFAELFGYAPGEIGNHITDLTCRVHPDDKPELMQKLQNCIVGRCDCLRNEHRAQCKDGSWKWVLARSVVLQRSSDAQALRIIGTLVDISQKKQAEAELAAASQLQQAVFDSISSQIAVLDQTGTVVQTNEAWRTYADEFECANSVGRGYLAVLSDLVAQEQQVCKAVAQGLVAVADGDLPHFYASEPIQSPCSKRWFTVKITTLRDEAHRMVVTHEDVSDLKRAELASLALANVDGLTGAMSRQHFMCLAEQEMARSVRYGLPLVVLMLDLDLFKHVNDTYGHQAGDVVLQGFMQTVKRVLRDSDAVGRIGGEEFAVLLPNTTQEGGRVLANRILEEVRSSPINFAGKHISYTVSIGAGFLLNQTSFSDVLAQCDAALYRAKNSGRDRVETSWDQAS